METAEYVSIFYLNNQWISVLAFSRTKGHGFLKPGDRDQKEFFHVSDVNSQVITLAANLILMITIFFALDCATRGRYCEVPSNSNPA